METQNYGKIKVGIDWEDKGWVSFNQETYVGGDELNNLPNARFFATQHSVYGDANFKITPTPLGLHGLESVEAYFLGDAYFTVGIHGGILHRTEILPATDYEYFFWVSSQEAWVTDAESFLTIEISEYDSDSNLTAITTHTLDLDLIGNNQTETYFIAFTSDASAAYADFTVRKTDPYEIPLHFKLHGIFRRAFSSLVTPNWNGGTVPPEEFVDNDITDWVLQAQGAIGKTNWETTLFDEGNLKIALNNADRRFSPEYADSPYYTYMKPYKKMWVAVERGDRTYTLLWSGWTHQFGLNTGNTGDRQAHITARHGKYTIEAQEPSELVAVSMTYSVDLIRLLLMAGYELSYADIDLADIEFSVIEREYANKGVLVRLFGAAFVGQEEKSFISSLENIAELNGNHLYLNRAGKAVFKPYILVRDTTPEELPYSLTREMHYVYAPTDLYKKMVVQYDVWQETLADIEMQGQDVIIPKGATDFAFRIDPTYNSRPLIGDVILDVSAFKPVDYDATPAFGSASAAFVDVHEGLYTWYEGLGDNTTDLDHRLSLISDDSGTVWYAIEINQEYTVTGLIDRALPTLTYKNPLVTLGSMAEDFAAMQINRRGSVVSWFEDAVIVNKNAEATDFIVNHSVGDIIYSSEEQMGEVPKSLIIIGENWTYEPGYLQMTYSIAPTGSEVDIAAFDYVVNGQVVDFTDESITSIEPSGYLWDFND